MEFAILNRPSTGSWLKIPVRSSKEKDQILIDFYYGGWDLVFQIEPIKEMS